MTGNRTPRRLALLGGSPAFPEKLHVGRPNLGDRQRFLERINDILDSRFLTNGGPYVQEFERQIAELTGVRHCIAVCNATTGLELVIRAADLSGEVIVPAFTFIATAHALEWQQIFPVFGDIDPETYNLDPSRIEELITSRTTGIIGVHLWGRPCDVAALTDIARRHHLKLFFDAAHSLGCTHQGQMVGSFGEAEVFSFHATKFVNSFEGGAIVTNNDELAARIRLMKNFGFAGYDTVIYAGTNGKMSEVSAAMGLTSLESLDEFIAVNRAHYRQYREELGELPGIRLVSWDETERCNYQYVVLEVEETRSGIGRDALIEVLWAENVIARRYFYPGCHRMEPYRSYYPNVGRRLPVTERVAGQVLLLPTGTGVTAAEIAAIGEIIRTAVQRGDVITEYLSRSRVGIHLGSSCARN